MTAAGSLLAQSWQHEVVGFRRVPSPQTKDEFKDAGPKPCGACSLLMNQHLHLGMEHMLFICC